MQPAIIKKGELPLQGVGVLRYPPGDIVLGEGTVPAARIARELAAEIRQGSVIALPGYRDSEGDYQWDFRIENGDPGQVKIERKE